MHDEHFETDEKPLVNWWIDYSITRSINWWDSQNNSHIKVIEIQNLPKGDRSLSSAKTFGNENFYLD